MLLWQAVSVLHASTQHPPGLVQLIRVDIVATTNHLHKLPTIERQQHHQSTSDVCTHMPDTASRLFAS